MTRVKLVSIGCFLNFIIGLLINLKTSHVKKDTEVVSVQKACLIKLS